MLASGYVHKHNLPEEDYKQLCGFLYDVTKTHLLVSKANVKREIETIENYISNNIDNNLGCAVSLMLKNQIQNILGVYQYNAISTEITQ